MTNENDNKQAPNKSIVETARNSSIAATIGVAFGTPFLGWTNLVLNAKQTNPNSKIMPYLFDKRVFRGFSSYVSFVAPATAMAVSSKKVLDDYLPSFSGKDFFSAFSSGYLTGLVMTPFEAIAQTATFAPKMSKLNLASKIYQLNGCSALFRGASIVCLREGLWNIACFSAPNKFANWYENLGLNAFFSQAAGAITSGAFCGFITSPFNLLRFNKQKNLDSKSTPESYGQTIKTMLSNKDTLPSIKNAPRFFRAAVPRSSASAVVATGIYLGSNYHQLKKNCS